MDTTSTIVAPATPMAPGARAMVRLSGPAAFDAIDALACEPFPRTRGVGPLRLRLEEHELPTLAVRLPAPASYTGEDTVELLPPGSPTLVAIIVRSLLRVEGVRHAEAGEFSARAYLNGRLTLEQAEGVAATIAAATHAQLDASHRLMSGRSGRLYAGIVDELASTLALVEAAADFAEEEHVVPISAGDLRARLRTMLEQIESEAIGRRGREGVAARPLVAIVGAPNAGKTSLFNALLGRTRAVASETEHATRDAIIEPLTIEHPTLGNISCDLADLPGLPAHATTPLARCEQDSIAQVIESITERCDVALLCDPAGGFDWPNPGRSTIRVRTKADMPDRNAPGCLAVSAHTALNLDSLRLAIAQAIESARRETTAGLLPRHAALASRAVASLAQAADTVASDPPGGLPIEGELIAAEMRLALDALGELGGRMHPDEVLGRIFASFCVGK